MSLLSITVRIIPILSIFTLFSLAFSFPLHADMGKGRGWIQGKYAVIVIDANRDKVLFSRKANQLRYPASLTKMMTLYILFDELSAGRLRKNTQMSVSKHAARQVPSNLKLKLGHTISVEHAIRALVTKSANDVAVVIAEHISGSERAFARRMTSVARKIGMKNTIFRNASGLPDSKQKSTAYDLSLLGRALYHHHPKYYSYFSMSSFSYKNHTYGNHNRLLRSLNGVDGIKTGYTNASGFNLVSSLRRRGRHLIAVVMGGPTGNDRDKHMKNLLKRYINHASANKKKGRRWFTVKSLRFAQAPLPNFRPLKEVKLALPVRSISPVVMPSWRPESRPIIASRPVLRSQIRLSSRQSESRNEDTFLSKLSNKDKKRRWMIQIGAYD
ncbi:MAG: D-alanyl-D-alanine carboxypeptidase, partial [Alphaproteobacteria bacterium]|nr:D-alanyl-D-alanine carboxypeptidase [Alphaproteobacteria bacterium]